MIKKIKYFTIDYANILAHGKFRRILVCFASQRYDI